MSSTIRGSDNFDSAQIVGPGQTWQNVIGSRAAGTTYTNTSGKPILWTVTFWNTAGSGNKRMNMYIGGNLMLSQSSFSSTGDTYCSGTLIVPAGSTYWADSTGTGATMSLTMWWELR